MRVGVAGASGFLGSALCAALRERGDDVVRFVRPSSEASPHSRGSSIRWDPERHLIDESDLAAVGGFDAVVNLAGVSVAGHRWTTSYRASVKESRTSSTRVLVEALASVTSGVAVLVNASAVGYYGNHGDEVIDESASPGDDFLAEVCLAWEAAAAPFAATGASLALMRTGIVLGPDGGVLERLVPLFRAGLGGVIATGRQWTCPISLRDHVAAMTWLIDRQLAGTFNFCAPEPCTNRQMTRSLAHALHRPALMRVPRAALRLALGRELADNTVLTSQRVVPTALLESGFTFSDPSIDQIVAAALA